MKKKATAVKKTVSFRPEVWEYVESHSNGNASAFINEALSNYRRRRLRTSMIRGYKAMASQQQLEEDLALWDTTLMDGLEDHPPR